MKKIMAAVAIALMLSPLSVSAEEEPELELIRTTVYYAHDGAKTATGKEARYGIVAYDPDYFGKACILYTEDMRYIGIFECEDTGGHRVRTGQVLDVYRDNAGELLRLGGRKWYSLLCAVGRCGGIKSESVEFI